MLSAIAPLDTGTPPAADPRRDAQLRHIAQEFESVMVAAMLKEGLRSATSAGTDDGDNGGSTYLDMTCEQLASFIGRQGVLGIADRIVDSLTPERSGNRHAKL